MSAVAREWERDPAVEAGWSTREHVRTVARRLGGDGAAVTRMVGTLAVPEITGLSGLAAATLVRDVAAGAVREYATTARGQGASWADIGAALGLAGETEFAGVDPGEAAWALLAEGGNPERRGWDPARLWWSCSTCGARVTDHGPGEPHPDDREDGHTSDCVRHIAAIAAWKADLGWDEDDPDDGGDLPPLRLDDRGFDGTEPNPDADRDTDTDTDTGQDIAPVQDEDPTPAPAAGEVTALLRDLNALREDPHADEVDWLGFFERKAALFTRIAASTHTASARECANAAWVEVEQRRARLDLDPAATELPAVDGGTGGASGRW